MGKKRSRFLPRGRPALSSLGRRRRAASLAGCQAGRDKAPSAMRKNVVVKPLTPNALDPVAGIERVAGEARWSRAQFEKELSSQISRFFVLQKGCNILGYGGYWKVDEEAQITNLVISPAARRRGMGRLLLKHLLERAAAEGCRAVTLEVRGRLVA